MPFKRPTLTELVERFRSDSEPKLQGADASLRRSVLAVLGRAHAGATFGLYGYIDFIASQVFPDTAEAEFLERWAAVWGVTRRAAGTAAGKVSITGTDGAVITAGTIFQLSGARQYRTTAKAVIASGKAVAAVEAVIAGAAGNALAGSAINLLSPIAGIQSAATVATGGLTGGADSEGDEELRARVLDRIQEPPHGGAASDYVKWALEVTGVARAWAFPREMGLGTVTVRFMTGSKTANGIPSRADVDRVYAYIEARRPVTAELFVVAPVAAPIAFEISGLSPNTAAVRAAIEAELRDLVVRQATPGGTLLLSRVREAVSVASGERDHVVVAPAANVVSSGGRISTFGSITWTA